MYLHILHIINGGPKEKQKVAKQDRWPERTLDLLCLFTA
jgi:hypothetical protein